MLGCKLIGAGRERHHEPGDEIVHDDRLGVALRAEGVLERGLDHRVAADLDDEIDVVGLRAEELACSV